MSCKQESSFFVAGKPALLCWIGFFMRSLWKGDWAQRGEKIVPLSSSQKEPEERLERQWTETDVVYATTNHQGHCSKKNSSCLYWWFFCTHLLSWRGSLALRMLDASRRMRRSYLSFFAQRACFLTHEATIAFLSKRALFCCTDNSARGEKKSAMRSIFFLRVACVGE